MHKRRSCARRVLPAALVLAALELLLPVQTESGQRAQVTPSLDVSTVHEDNLLWSVVDRRSDRILRISPAVSVERKSPRVLFAGSYGLDAEQYATYRKLSTPSARAFATSAFRYEAGQRTSLSADSTFLHTRTPSELNTMSAVATSRMRALRVGAGTSLDYRLNQTLTASATYRTTHDTLQDGTTASVRVAATGIERSMTRRDRVSVVYEDSRYVFVAAPGRASRAVQVGWITKLSTRTELALSGGPRDTDGARTPDIRAQLNHTLERGRATLTYQRTQTTVLGVVDPISAETFDALATWSPASRLTTSARSAMFRTANPTFGATGAHLNLGARYELSKSLALDVEYAGYIQHFRHRAHMDPEMSLERHSLLFGLAVR